MAFANGLRKHGIPFELHIYPDGPHGLSLADEETEVGDMGCNPHISGWIDLCTEWLKIEFNKCRL